MLLLTLSLLASGSGVLHQHGTIAALRFYREQTGAGLAEATLAVEALARQQDQHHEP